MTTAPLAYAHEPDATSERLGRRLNWLRAGVLGANDGIISVAGLLLGVAGATKSPSALLITGMAGLVSGALSMGGGEYVSVSSQRDTERASLAQERAELEQFPEEELEELTQLYAAKGLDRDLAHAVAAQLTERDALAAHAEVELGIDAEEFTSPTHAAIASMAAFAVGALIPILFILLSPATFRVPATIVAVAVALLLTGFIQTRLGGGSPWKPMARNLVVGLVAMAITYGIGHLVGAQV